MIPTSHTPSHRSPTEGSPTRGESAGVPLSTLELFASESTEINALLSFVLSTKGKAIRRTLCEGVATALEPEAVVPMTVLDILETLHYSTLIHDDIIDRSPTRRGLPAVWKAYSPDIALLIGDYLHAKVFKIIAAHPDIPQHIQRELSQHFAQASASVQEGQLLETMHQYDTGLSENEYTRIAELKTGALISLAVSTATLFTSAKPRQPRALSAFALHFGIAFQIYNDIVDLEEGHGKDSLDDLRAGKMTLPMILHLQMAGDADAIRRSYARRAFGGMAVDAVRQLLGKTRALARASCRLIEHISHAESSLSVAIGQKVPDSIKTIHQCFKTTAEHYIDHTP